MHGIGGPEISDHVIIEHRPILRERAAGHHLPRRPGRVAAMPGASARTLHFYDETGLLTPAFLGEICHRENS
jgi:hypothetical protein